MTPFVSAAPASDGGVLLNLEFVCGPAMEEEAPQAERIGRRGLVCEVWIPIEDVTLASLENLRVKVPWRSLDGRGARHSLYVFEQVNQRFEVVEGVLREMSEQMVMQSRGIKVAIEARTNIEKRVDDHERRIAELEQRQH